MKILPTNIDLRGEKTLHKYGGPRLALGSSRGYNCSIEERDGEGYLVENHNGESTVLSRIEEPDLFTRFAGLPETADAYLEFTSRYGLLGLSREYKAIDQDWGEQPLVLVNDFHQRFKTALVVAKRFVGGEAVDEDEIWIGSWLSQHIRAHTSINLWDLRGGMILDAETLIGALTLQLYHFTLFRKPLRECFLPGCHAQTTKKYCSSNHQKLFNHWKATGRMVEDDQGHWRRLPRKKPGRPRKKKEEQRP